MIFVTGEAGIGKTTFVWTFLDSVPREGTARVGSGQCVEQYGGGEPYMPVLEALTRLGRKPAANAWSSFSGVRADLARADALAIDARRARTFARQASGCYAAADVARDGPGAGSAGGGRAVGPRCSRIYTGAISRP